MFKSYFRIALRSQLKNRVSSIINIGGLAVGMAVALLIGLWIHDELSYNQYHTHYDRIARVMQTQTYNGSKSTQPTMPYPIGVALQNRFGSEFKYVVMSSWFNEHILTAGEKKLSRSGGYMDKDVPAMLTLKMTKGSYDGLNAPNSILLSASTASAIFGGKDPLGQGMRIDNKLNVIVTGVYEDLPYSSDFRNVQFIAPWDLYMTSESWLVKARQENQWDNNSFQTFVQLADHADLRTVNKKIASLKRDNDAPEDKKLNTALFLFPMRDWHLRSHFENGRQSGGPIEYVWLFALVGIFVLILACINFMNLSTARSEQRAKEVGIRKAIGSLRGHLIAQFYSESLLVTVAAFILSLLLVESILPWFNQLADKQMIVPWGNPFFWLIGLAFCLLTGLIAGSYPALYLSSFRPIKVLKGIEGIRRYRTSPKRGTKLWRSSFRVGRLASMPRKVLVVLQFTISLVLIIGTIVVYSQIQYARNRPIGYDRNGLMVIRMKSPDFYGKYGVLRTELKNTGAVEELSEASSPLNTVWASNNGFQWPGKDPNFIADLNTIWVTHEYGRTVGWQFTAGRDFSRDFSGDSSALVINEAAVSFMHIKDPIGTIVRWGNDENAPKYTIVGVIKDMVMESPYENVRQTFYFMDYNRANFMVLKLDPNKSASQSIAKIGTVFRRLVPSAPFDYEFADNAFAAKFATEERIGKLSTFFAFLAIFISCLGLFGLA